LGFAFETLNVRIFVGLRLFIQSGWDQNLGSDPLSNYLLLNGCDCLLPNELWRLEDGGIEFAGTHAAFGSQANRRSQPPSPFRPIRLFPGGDRSHRRRIIDGEDFIDVGTRPKDVVGRPKRSAFSSASREFSDNPNVDALLLCEALHLLFKTVHAKMSGTPHSDDR
jgi:hypothetical protein